MAWVNVSKENILKVVLNDPPFPYHLFLQLAKYIGSIKYESHQKH
jgi:hypothetical protein